MKFMCCNVDYDTWALNQTEIMGWKGRWGVWNGMVMCKNGTYVMGMDGQMETHRAVDDTAMGGAAIYCDSLEGDDLNTHIIESEYGEWENELNNFTQSVIDKTLYNAVSVRNEKKQGLFGDDSAMNGFKIGKAHNIIKILGGRWSLAAKGVDKDNYLTASLNTTYHGIAPNQKVYTDPTKLTIVGDTKLDFEVYK